MCSSYMWKVSNVRKESSFKVHLLECPKSYWHLHNPDIFRTYISKVYMFSFLLEFKTPLVISISPEFE